MHPFLVYAHGHCSGGWHIAVWINNPDITAVVLGEAWRVLDMERRGLVKRSPDYDRALIQFFEDGLHWQWDAAGVVKSFRASTVKWVLAHGGRIAQTVRNPLFIAGHWAALPGKHREASTAFAHKYHRPAATDRERFEGIILHCATNFYTPFLARSSEYPLIRVEDTNQSMARDCERVRVFCEWLTQCPFGREWMAYVQEHYLPAYDFDHHLEWRDGRVYRFYMARRAKVQWPDRLGWHPDPVPAQVWARWADWQRAIYKRYFQSLDVAYGYNQTAPGSTEDRWACAGMYPWSDL